MIYDWRSSMNSLINCVIYIIVSGLVIFILGRLFPRKWIKESKFPFKAFKIENNGKLYDKINIRKWKTKLPDASLIITKFIPNFMPKKRIDNKYKSKDNTKILIKETCIAEINHFLAGITGLYCIKIWNGTGGLVVSLLYLLWNMPFILIQRYNRPRLVKLK